MTEAIDRAQSRLIVWIVLATLVLWAATTVDLARGGRPDPPALRAAATLLNGPWRFHTGDDPRWSDPRADDGGWERIDLTAKPGSHDGDVGLPDHVGGWMAHGHPGYTGYAWYRRGVDVPAGPAAWDILGPTQVEDGYELFWNGRLLGGSGRLGPHPRVVGTRPLRFALPADAASKSGVLAIRAFALPRGGPSPDGGGLHSAPILAPKPVSDGLHRAQWERTIAGYVVDAIEPAAMVALAALAMWMCPRSRRKGFLLLASLALVLMAARRFNNALVSWTDVMDLPTYSFLAKYMWMPATAAWALAWNRWGGRPWRIIDAAAVAIMVAEIVAVVIHAGNVTSLSRWASIFVFFVIGARIARGGPMRGLALGALGLLMVSYFGELLDLLHVPDIWFPFGIGVSRTQYIYAIVLPLLAVLIARTLEDRRPPARLLRKRGDGGLAGVRTQDHSIKSRMLYH